MERKTNLFIIIVGLYPLISSGQNSEAIYKAYIKGDMEKWKYSIDSLENIRNKTNNEKLELINYQYGYIAWCINEKKINEAERYIAKAEELIDFLEKQPHSLSTIYAYKAAFVGFKIGISPYKAPLIGSQSLAFAKKSVALDSTNSIAYIQVGNIAYYTPKIFGGSKFEALQYYKLALHLMEKESCSANQNWNYLNLLAILIQAYFDTGQYNAAKKYCIKALTIEPEFDWVKNKLYPEILKLS
jgi:tetratricopeptide (TPR) repeat protein